MVTKPKMSIWESPEDIYPEGHIWKPLEYKLPELSEHPLKPWFPEFILPKFDIDKLIKQDITEPIIFPAYELPPEIKLDIGWAIEAGKSIAGEMPPLTLISPMGERFDVTEEFKRAEREYSERVEREIGRAEYAWELEQERLMTEYIGIVEKNIEAALLKLYPETNIENLYKFITETPEDFVRSMLEIGRTPETEGLLRAVGIEPSSIYGISPITPTFEEIEARPIKEFEGMPLLKEYESEYFKSMGWEYRINRGFASPEELKLYDERLKEAQEAYKDKYEELSAWARLKQVAPFWKDVGDAFYLSVRNMAHLTKNYFISTLPELIFDDSKVSPYLPPEEREEKLALNQRMRDYFRGIYAKSQKQGEDWIDKHPELVKPEKYQGDPFKTGLWKDPGYLIYSFAEQIPFTLAIMATTVGVSVATYGNVPAGLLAGFALATPFQSQDIYEELIANGAKEGDAARLAFGAGLIISSLDSVGNLPIMNAISNPTKVLTDGVHKSILRQIASNLAKRGLKVAGQEIAIEEITENLQQAIQNAVVNIYDKDRSIFEGISETAFKTLITVTPMAIFGGTMSMRHISSAEASKVKDEIKVKEGWEQDRITGEWYKPEKLSDSVTEDINRFMDAGLSRFEATIRALNEAAKTPEGSKSISDYLAGLTGIVPETAKAIGEARAELGAKEPWMMTRDEWVRQEAQNLMGKGLSPAIEELSGAHLRHIQKAISEGKPVPAEVLKDYPELAKEKPAIPIVEPKRATGLKEVVTPGTTTLKIDNKKITYDMGSLSDAIRAAKKLKSNIDLYVYPTGVGIQISKEPPPFGIQHIIIKPDGTHKVVPAWSSWEAGRKAGVEPVKPAKMPVAIPEAKTIIDKYIEKWEKAKVRNTEYAEADLSKLESMGYDVSDARQSLLEYKDIERSDYDNAEEFSEARTEAWDEFTKALNEIEELYIVKPEIPKAEPGMPEAGLQPSMIPEEVTAKEVRPKGKGKVTQISMEDQLKLEEARRAAEEAPSELKEAYEAQAEIEGLRTWLETEPAVRLTNLIKKTGWYKGEVNNLTKEQYRDLTGKEPKDSILGTETQTVTRKAYTTKAGKYKPETTYKTSREIVRWEYALDDIATELGYEDAQTLKEAIERVGTGLERIKELKSKISRIETKPLPALPEPIEKPVQPREIAPTAEVEEIITPPPEVPPAILEDTAPIPDDMPNTKKVLGRISFEPDKQSLKDKLFRGWHKFQVKMIDDLYPIKKYVHESKKGGLKLSFEENPYIAARLLRGVVSKATVFLEKGTFGRKYWKTEKGKAVPNYKGKSFEDIISPVRKDETKWRDFTAYLTAIHSMELSDAGIVTGIDKAVAERAITELDKKYSNFAKMASQLYDYNSHLLDYIQESGLISEELRGKLDAKYFAYVPFYRVLDHLQNKGYMGKKLANIASPIKRIKGSEKEIINPLESIVKNTYAFISAADRNEVGIMMARMAYNLPDLQDMFAPIKTPIARVATVTAKELGIEIDGLNDEQTEGVFNVFRPSMYSPENTVTVMIDGKKKFFKVDPDLYEGLLMLDRPNFGAIAKILSMPAKWLRAGATLSPDFQVRNPTRDQLTAFCYSMYGFMPGVDFVKGLASLIKKDTSYQLYKMSGAEHAMLVSMDREYLSKTFKEIIQGKGFKDYVKHPLELMQIISAFGEKATRLGEFKRGIARGVTPIEAGYSSREVSLDFAKAGTNARAMNMITAFFNANIRGWDKMITSFKDRPIKTSTKVFLGITLPSIILYLVNRDDPRWEDIPQWQKDLFWIIFTKDTIYRIPKPFELGVLFGSVPERFMEWLDTNKKGITKEVWMNAFEAGMPGIIPTAALPIIEAWTNYNFFLDRPIVPESREGYPKKLQYTNYTSETSKKIGELINYSPAKIDNIINGWTGGLGRYIVNIMDKILQETGISPMIVEPSPTKADIPVIKAFVVRNPFGSSSQVLNDFYNKLKEYEANEKYLKELAIGDDIDKFDAEKSKHPELLFAYDFNQETFYSATAKYLRGVANQISQIRKKEDEVYKSKDLTPKQKREIIDQLDKLRTEVARKALNYIEGPKESDLSIADKIKDAEKGMGKVTSDVPLLSLEQPEIKDMKEVKKKFNAIFKTTTIDDVKGKEGDYTPLSINYLEMKRDIENSSSLPNISIYQINTDPEKGETIDDFIDQWNELQTITDPLEKADYLYRHPKAPLGNITPRQLEILKEYSKAEDKKGFLKEKGGELKFNPFMDWLEKNHEANARMAIWGEAKIQNNESFMFAKELLKELGIPDKALTDKTLPPERELPGFIEFENAVKEFGDNSIQVLLVLKKNPELFKYLYPDRDPIEQDERYLQIKVDNAEKDNLYDGIRAELKKEGLTGKKLEDAVKAAQDEFKGDNKDWWDSRIKADDVYSKIKPWNKDEAWVKDADEIANKWVERSQIMDLYGNNSAKMKQWYFDNRNIYDWAVEHELITDNISEWNPDLTKLESTWYDKIKEYEDYIPLRNAHITNTKDRDKAIEDARAEMMKDEKFKLAYREIDFYKSKIEPQYKDIFIEYYNQPEYGKYRQRILAKNIPFATQMKEHNKITGFPKLLSEIPDEEYDRIYERYKGRFDIIESYKDIKSPNYIEDESERTRTIHDMLRNPNNKTFALAYYSRQAYELFVPKEFVSTYADYKLMMLKGNPNPDLPWYEDEWFLQENVEFYRKMKDMKLITAKDFRNVPTRDVFKKYQYYLSIPEYQRKQYRADNLDLDKWLVSKGYIPIQKWIDEQREKAEKGKKPKVPEWKQRIREWESIIKEPVKIKR